MADTVSTSGDVSDIDNARKRKLINTSDSMDTSISSPGRKYKLRRTTTPGCIFAVKSLSHGQTSASTTSSGSQDSSTTASNVRGPSTSNWGAVHTNRLNFLKVNQITDYPSVEDTFKSTVNQQLMRLILEPLKSHDGTELAGPAAVIVKAATKKKIMEACTGEDNVLEYMEAVVDAMGKNKINLRNTNQEDLPAVRASLRKMKKEQKTKNVKLSDETIRLFNYSFAHMFDICSSDSKTEVELDELIVSMMHLVEQKEGPDCFKTRKRDESKVIFECCGTQVTSITNVLWQYYQEDPPVPFSAGFPILLSENKSPGTGRLKLSKSTGYHSAKTTYSYHKKITQVIGQCVSMADKSPYETKDYKILYHVSVMGTFELIVTRSHIAKSTLKAIKEGCPIPNQQDLDPSYVFESRFVIDNNVVTSFLHVYFTFVMFGKLGQIVVSEKPRVQGNKDNVRSVREKLKRAFKRKPSSNPSTKK